MSLVPQRVTGELAFSAVEAANGFTCAIDLEGAPWCWGSNFARQLGDDPSAHSTRPVRIETEVRFRSLSAEGTTVCGVSVEDEVWCWGFLDALATRHDQYVVNPTPIPTRVAPSLER